MALTLLGTGVAAASADDCGTKYCISVTGSGLKVDRIYVTTKSGKAVTGFFFVTATKGSTTKWDWYYHKVTATGVPFDGKTYANGTQLCGGVAPAQAEMSYAGLGCITVHS